VNCCVIVLAADVSFGETNMKRNKNVSLNPPVPSGSPFKSVKEIELGIFVDVDKDKPEHQKYSSSLPNFLFYCSLFV
jgi:hypothetical protein